MEIDSGSGSINLKTLNRRADYHIDLLSGGIEGLAATGVDPCLSFTQPNGVRRIWNSRTVC